MTMLRFNADVTDLLQQYTERGHTALIAAAVHAYIMTREASPGRLRSEGATTVHDVPGRRGTTTPPKPQRASPSPDTSVVSRPAFRHPLQTSAEQHWLLVTAPRLTRLHFSA
ncbi:hypothetical protein ACGF8B_38070 [Streptomyces sp. NPDC047917]|uniref:hypothetical protein n=1 Tax=Streptomyces sp. NPDC047917 TaxID=3365491 RepID=UPI0037177B9F